MKTTLMIPDNLVRTIKRRAAERGTTLSQIVAEALARGLEAAPTPDLAPLPTHRMGKPRVDVADRNALYDAMGRRVVRVRRRHQPAALRRESRR